MSMFRTIFTVTPLALLVLFGCARPLPHAGPASEAGWTLLGERTVNGKADRDVIVLGGGRGTVQRLRIEVTGSALTMHDIVVTFANGEKYSPDTRLVFDRGSTSRSIDLPGRVRNIERVSFRYGNLPGGGRAHVRLLGR